VNKLKEMDEQAHSTDRTNDNCIQNVGSKTL